MFFFGSVYGLKSWVYLIFFDLIYWDYEGIVFYFDFEYDFYGVYLGLVLLIDN